MTRILEIETKLRDAIAKAQAAGFTIARGVTINALDKKCCALGSLGVGRVLFFFNKPHGLAEEIGMNFNESWAFADGFDGYGLGNGTNTHAFYDLGRRLGDEFCGAGK